MPGRIPSSLAALILAGLLAAGCSTSSTGPEPADHTGYPERTTPANVIATLEMAYENMDAEAYLDCLAENFIFFMNPGDITDDPTLPEFWNKAVETAIHLNMFGEGEPHVERIELVFTHVDAIWDDGDPGDPLDDLWAYIEDIDLRVHLPEDLILWAEAPAEFLFRVDPDETGPEGEILWEIWRQWDLNEEGCGESSGRREEASWGSVKALFR